MGDERAERPRIFPAARVDRDVIYFWKRELQVRDAAAAEIAPAKLPAPKFVPVTVLAGSTLSVEVRCPSGRVVLLPACEVASLSSLLAAQTSPERETRSC